MSGTLFFFSLLSSFSLTWNFDFQAFKTCLQHFKYLFSISAKIPCEVLRKLSSKSCATHTTAHSCALHISSSVKSWKTTLKRRTLSTTIRPPCWKDFHQKITLCSWKREIIKTKKQNEKENSSFFFYSQADMSFLRVLVRYFLNKIPCLLRVW